MAANVNVCLWTTCLSDWVKGRDGLGNLPLPLKSKRRLIVRKYRQRRERSLWKWCRCKLDLLDPEERHFGGGRGNECLVESNLAQKFLRHKPAVRSSFLQVTKTEARNNIMGEKGLCYSFCFLGIEDWLWKCKSMLFRPRTL
jgi:hypothetical protein